MVATIRTGFSLVIPAFNEAEVIARAITEAEVALSAHFADFEILVVDDGSSDPTASEVFRARAPHTRLLRHGWNRGYGAALRTGFEAARFPLVAFTDADCQFDLTDLARLADVGEDGALLLCADSTYAEIEGYTPSEQRVAETLERAIGDAEGRVIVTTFASLISRVSLRSSSNTLTNGWLNRAETFQSMERMSSPSWYSRTSLNAIPRPLNTEWYSPEKIWFTSPFVRISIFRTFFMSSAVSMGRTLFDP